MLDFAHKAQDKYLMRKSVSKLYMFRNNDTMHNRAWAAEAFLAGLGHTARDPVKCNHVSLTYFPSPTPTNLQNTSHVYEPPGGKPTTSS